MSSALFLCTNWFLMDANDWQTTLKMRHFFRDVHKKLIFTVIFFSPLHVKPNDKALCSAVPCDICVFKLLHFSHFIDCTRGRVLRERSQHCCEPISPADGHWNLSATEEQTKQKWIKQTNEAKIIRANRAIKRHYGFKLHWFSSGTVVRLPIWHSVQSVSIGNDVACVFRNRLSVQFFFFFIMFYSKLELLYVFRVFFGIFLLLLVYTTPFIRPFGFGLYSIRRQKSRYGCKDGEWGKRRLCVWMLWHRIGYTLVFMDNIRTTGGAVLSRQKSGTDARCKCLMQKKKHTLTKSTYAVRDMWGEQMEENSKKKGKKWPTWNGIIWRRVENDCVQIKTNKIIKIKLK